jgi:hypothetical protein
MGLGDVVRVHLPYCIDRQEDGSYVVLNREYKPLGFKTNERIDYSVYPIGVRLPGLRPATAAKISYSGSSDLSRIYLYEDGCVPTDKPAYMEAYLKRLAHFAKLKIG